MAPSKGIGTKIRRARERKRLKQAELADALGVSRSAVNAWENDRAYPQNSIGALEEVLGVRLDEPEPEPAIPPGILALIRRYYSPEQQREIIETLTAIGNPPPGEEQSARHERDAS